MCQDSRAERLVDVEWSRAGDCAATLVESMNAGGRGGKVSEQWNSVHCHKLVQGCTTNTTEQKTQIPLPLLYKTTRPFNSIIRSLQYYDAGSARREGDGSMWTVGKDDGCKTGQNHECTKLLRQIILSATNCCHVVMVIPHLSCHGRGAYPLHQMELVCIQ